MYHHVVMWTLIEPKSENRDRLRYALQSLPKNIPEILEWDIAQNLSRSNVACDLVLCSTFRNFQEFKKYRKDPKHKEVITLINEVTCETHVVDFDSSSFLQESDSPRLRAFQCARQGKSGLLHTVKRKLGRNQ